jgi:hypothetical protein
MKKKLIQMIYDYIDVIQSIMGEKLIILKKGIDILSHEKVEMKH